MIKSLSKLYVTGESFIHAGKEAESFIRSVGFPIKKGKPFSRDMDQGWVTVCKISQKHVNKTILFLLEEITEKQGRCH